MKNIYSKLILAVMGMIMMWSCEKEIPLAHFSNGSNAVLTANATTVAPVVADSLKEVVSFSWSNPKYATDSSTVKYILQVDSTGRNFSKAYSITLTNKLAYTFVARDLNAILLSLGFKYNTSYKVDVRILSSYANNNDQLASNVLTLNMTPYVIPPKVVPPSSKKLFLVGDATAGGWNNPVPEKTQAFTRVDSVTYEGTFYLIGGKQYLALPVNGDWSAKYSVANNSVSNLSAGGDFGANLSDNFPGPAKTGLYKIRFDFQAGKFTVTAVQVYGLLYVPGGYQGWNPGAAPTLASIKADGNYSGYVNFSSSSDFKLTSQSDWSGTNYGDGGAGSLSTSGGNLSVTSAGFYLINANTTDNTWTATRTTWSIVGAFSGWGSNPDTQLTNDNGVWKGTLVLAADSEFKFRANNDWSINLGDDGADGSLDYNGANLSLTAGTYSVELNLNNAGYYTYKFTKQ